MFDNIGSKLQWVAEIAFCIFAVIYGIAGLICSVYFGFEEESFLLFVVIILSAAVMIFADWVFCAILYAFGELVENVSLIAKRKKELIPGNSSDAVAENSAAGNSASKNAVNTGKVSKQTVAVSKNFISKSEFENISVSRRNPLTDNAVFFRCKVIVTGFSLVFDDGGKNKFEIAFSDIKGVALDREDLLTVITASETISMIGLPANLTAIKSKIINS